MAKWIKDALDAAAMVRRIRRGGTHGKLIIMPEDEYKAFEGIYGDVCADRRALYQCVEDMAHGRTRCRYCDAYDACQSAQRGWVRGCSEWMLKFPGKGGTGNEQAAAQENRAPEQDTQATPGGNDEGAADRGPDQKRDHGGRPGEGMA